MKIKQSEKFTYIPLAEKEKRSLEIFSVIRKNETVSRKDISQITGINIVSISNYIKNYIQKRLVLEKGLDVSTGGRKPELVELNADENYIIGVGINQSETSGVMTDIAVNIKQKTNMPTSSVFNPSLVDRTRVKMNRVVTSKIIELIEGLIKKSNVETEKIKAIAIAIPNIAVVSVADISKKFGIETFIGSDAMAAAFAEKTMNPEADEGTVLYMYSDLGRGVVIKGDIFFAAEDDIGMVEVPLEDILKEDKETFLNHLKYLRPWDESLGILTVARREIGRGVGTAIVAMLKGGPDAITDEACIEAARQNDDVARDIIQGVGVNLGLRIAYLVNLFNPKTVVIGGGVETAGEFVLEPARKMVKRLALDSRANLVNIVLSVLGKDAVSLGAASLAAREMFLKA